jgi:hypothetical protein
MGKDLSSYGPRGRLVKENYKGTIVTVPLIDIGPPHFEGPSSDEEEL